MSKSIPLGPALCVQLICIIVGYILGKSLDVVLEALARESWCLWMVQRETGAVLAYS